MKGMGQSHFYNTAGVVLSAILLGGVQGAMLPS
ncbi:Uncharacterised protein [Serratia fonticola]|uniref:Uncharacterized protein n=1 Tax=Serratia fonticola TaxID=47917 RepID=A0A4U9V3X3_SERFO|nr:Uncharacterised protein [Serratia fonticola]VTR37494.1 Uncharacterised protein [Serratia fonticola]